MYGQNHKKIRCKLLSGAIFLALFSSFATAATIIKWIDEKGKTHYGDRIPEQYANHKNTIMTTQGVTLKQNQAVDYQDLQKQQAQAAIAEDQANKDRALLNSYTSDKEIDLAYARTLEIDNATLQGLDLNKRLAAGRLLDSQRKIATIQTAKKPVPSFISKEMVDNQASYTRTLKSIEQKKQEMVETKLKFEVDAKRYKELKASGVSR